MLTKAERDEIRAYCESARRCSHKQHMTWAHQDKLAAMGIKALDDLDAQDAEIQSLKISVDCAIAAGKSWEHKQPFCGHENRFGHTDDGGKTTFCAMCQIAERDGENARLTAENDRLIATVRADEWQSRYWAEHDKVADRDTEIRALHQERRGEVWFWQSDEEDHLESLTCPVLIPADALRKLLADRDTAIAEFIEIRKIELDEINGLHAKVADREATIMAERAQAAAMRKALERHVEICGQSGSHRAANVLLSAEAALQSGAGKALLDAHAAELKALRQRAEAAEANLIEARKTAEGHREPCYYCGKPTNNLSANPGKWSVGLCHGDDPGRLKWHHESCVSERLARLEVAETRATCDGSTERSHAGSTKAAIAALWETNPEIAYESPAQVIAWLKGRAETAESFRATFERPRGLRSGQCCDPVIDGEICALLLRVEAAEATVEAVKVEISGDANFGCMVELLFYGPFREKEEELRLAHGKIAELEGELAERALGGEGK